MDTDLRILVIILSVFLALFLLLSIIALVFVIRVLSHIKRIMQKAEAVADKVEHISAFFEKTAGPASLLKLVGNIADSFTHSRKKSSKRRRDDE